MTVGTSQARLMLGFMITTMFLSMWISNTATTAMMLPIVDAVAEAINSKVNNKQKYLQTTLYHVCQSDKESYRAVAKRYQCQETELSSMAGGGAGLDTIPEHAAVDHVEEGAETGAEEDTADTNQVTIVSVLFQINY